MIRCGNPDHYLRVIDEDEPGYQDFADRHPQHHRTVREVRECFASEEGIPSIEDEERALEAAIDAYEWNRDHAY